MSRVDRRTFLRHTAVAGGTAVALQGLIARGTMAAPAPAAQIGTGSYGPLVPRASNNTGETLLALPEGFQYNVIGKRGEVMTDGRLTPGAHDGQAAFAVGGMIHLVRNHEQGGGGINATAFGALPYDPKAEGGTTTLVIDPATRLISRHFASLSGTVRNCAGGPTPWGSWISNEETIDFPVQGSNFYQKIHGYNFEVSASAETEVEPLALNAMGRFSHEAVAVDPATNWVYETEDANPSGFYRFIPHSPGTPGDPSSPAVLAAGGTLEMLAVRGRRRYDTRRNQTAGQPLAVEWVMIDDPDPALENGALSTVNQGRAKGGAIFARLEGCWYGDGSVFIVSTSGGNIGRGQVWQYTPEGANDGTLTLLYESRDANVLDAPDNICVSPRGGLVLCEDGGGEQFVHGLTRQGEIFRFAKNIVPGQSGSEFAGSTFSPDGETMFVNIQGPGLTFAIWTEAGRSWSDGAL